MNSLDFSGLTTDEARAVQSAISHGENFHGYIPTASLAFIVRNYRELAALGALEASWLDAYVHASHFNAHDVSVLKAVFDACDRKRLRSLKPLGDDAIHGRFTLFRGCAGPVHSWGMSWTSPRAIRRSRSSIADLKSSTNVVGFIVLETQFGGS